VAYTATGSDSPDNAFVFEDCYHLTITCCSNSTAVYKLKVLNEKTSPFKNYLLSRGKASNTIIKFNGTAILLQCLK
jgi:hypothetical protein